MSLLAELKRRNVLRVAAAYVAVAWLVIQVVETLFPMFGLGEAAARTVVIILAVGFVPAMVLSWIFELTPEGFRRDSQVDHSAPSARTMARRLDRVIVVALVFAVGYFAVDKFVFDPARDAEIREQAREEGRAQAVVGAYGDKSIAVLPFADMSPDGDQAWFSEGIAEELLNLLARIPELRVISRSSSFSVARENLEVPEIAERLHVAHVLEGSVRLAGNTIRITAQLIDARSDSHLWSDTYDRELGDIFEIQDDIAAEVVKDLEVTLLRELPSVHRTDPEALRLTLQARRLFWSESSRGFEGQMALLEKALEIDPDYVPALMQLAGILWQVAVDPERDGDADIQLMLQMIAHAASVAPDDPSVIAFIGWTAFEFAGDIEKAAEDLERAVELAPSDVDILMGAAGFGERIGAYDVVLALRKRMVAVDPACFGCLGMLARAYINVDRFDDAMQTWEDYSRLVPGQRYWTKGMLHLLRGEPAEALVVFEMEGFINDHGREVGRAMALYDLGRREEARAALARHIENFGDVNPAGAAVALAWMGDFDAAFGWLHRTIEKQGPSAIIRVMNQPEWRRLREHPRWAEIAAEIGLDPERVAALDFDPSLP
jgi:adenylate cyclase